MKTKPWHIDYLDCGIPRWIIETAFGIMIIAALLCATPTLDWMSQHMPVTQSILNTVGMVVIYLCFLRGMKGLAHPLTALWWAAIVLNLLGFAVSCFGQTLESIGAATAAALPLVYLPLGFLLALWYRGRLASAGIWMVIRILIANLVPVLFYVTGWIQTQAGTIVMDVITVAADLVYAFMLRRVLVK